MFPLKILVWKGYLKICQYSFLVFEKGDKQKKCARFFKISKYTVLIFEKGDKQKIVPGFSKFVSIFLF